MNFDELCVLIKKKVLSAKVDHIEHISRYFSINVIKHY